MSKTVPCPACKQPAQWNENPYRPFCSEACKRRDLGRWATEEYRVPVEDTFDKEDKPAWKPRIVPKDPSEEDPDE